MWDKGTAIERFADSIRWYRADAASNCSGLIMFVTTLPRSLMSWSSMGYPEHTASDGLSGLRWAQCAQLRSDSTETAADVPSNIFCMGRHESMVPPLRYTTASQCNGCAGHATDARRTQVFPERFRPSIFEGLLRGLLAYRLGHLLLTKVDSMRAVSCPVWRKQAPPH